MNRRGFLGSILAACAAPAIVRADSLMRILPTETVVASITAQDIINEALKLLDRTNLNFTSRDLAMSLDEFSSRVIFPAADVITQRLEFEQLRILRPTLVVRRSA